MNLSELAAGIDRIITKRAECAEWAVVSVELIFGEIYLACGRDGEYFALASQEGQTPGGEADSQRTDLSLTTENVSLFDGGDF